MWLQAPFSLAKHLVLIPATFQVLSWLLASSTLTCSDKSSLIPGSYLSAWQGTDLCSSGNTGPGTLRNIVVPTHLLLPYRFFVYNVVRLDGVLMGLVIQFVV